MVKSGGSEIEKMISKIRCRDWIDTEKDMWVVSPEYHALLRAGKDKKTTIAEKFFEKYPLYKPEWYHASGVLTGDYIVCVPSSATDIAVYSFGDRSMYYIPIAISDQICQEIYNPTYKFFKAYAYDRGVLIFGTTYPVLININPEEKKIDYIDGWVTDAEKYILQRGSDFYFGDGYVRLGNDLFIPMSYCGAFLVTNLETLQCRVVFPLEEMDSIEGVTKIADKLCFIGRKGELYYLCFWNPRDKKMKKLQIPYQGKCCAWISFLSPVFWKSKVYLVPQTADHFYVVDLESEEIKIEKNLEMMISEFPEETQDIKVGTYKQNGNIVIFNTWWDYKWHKYNLDTWEHEEFELQLNDEDYVQYCQKAQCDKLIDERSIISEKTIPLPVFLNKVKNMEQSHSECEGASSMEEQKWKTFLKTEL